jgi:NADH dehydrogenase/NADH:ubiquinone oxidoreductase subunit G
MEICDNANTSIPRFCYDGCLSTAGNCRICFVEVQGSSKPIVSCTFPATPGLVVFTESPLVKKSREGVMEFLLIQHPLDCPVCDQGSECDLQNYSDLFGTDSTRYLLLAKREVGDKNMGLSIKTVMNRCIHCTRCLRFLKPKSFPLRRSLGTLGRSDKTEISFYFKTFNDTSLLLGNVVDLCPVGILYSTRRITIPLL